MCLMCIHEYRVRMCLTMCIYHVYFWMYVSVRQAHI